MLVRNIRLKVIWTMTWLQTFMWLIQMNAAMISFSVTVLSTLTTHRHHFFSVSAETCCLDVVFSLCFVALCSFICFAAQLLPLSFLLVALSACLCLLIHSITWSNSVAHIVFGFSSAYRHLHLFFLFAIHVALSWVKVACHYRCRHRSDKGQKLKQKCL